MASTPVKSRVVFYGHCAKMSGAEIALLNTTANMVRCEPLVILGEDGPLVGRLRDAGVSVQLLPLQDGVRNASRSKIGLNRRLLRTALGAFSYIRGLRSLIMECDPDIVVSNSMKGHVLVALTGVWMQKKFVCYIRDRITTDFMSRLGVVLMRTTLSIAPSGIVANSNSTLQTVPVRRRGGRDIVVPSPIIVANTTAQGSIDDGVHYALVGRIAEWKGQKLALEAFAEVSRMFSCRLTFIGGALFEDEDYLTALKESVGSLGLSDSVRFAGHVDDVYAELKNVDVAIHASIIPEPFGQVVVQAMAMGLPVIASGEGGPLETITDGVDGVLFAPRDVTSLIEKMRLLGESRSLRSELGERASVSALDYSPGVLVGKLEAFLIGL